MIKTTFAMILILLVIAASGCVEKEEISTTTYICQECGELYLHSDGTFHVNSLQSGASNGNYTIINDILFLDYSLGISFMLTQNSTDYIDKDGDRWIRQTI